jgi:hypothetical protein
MKAKSPVRKTSPVRYAKCTIQKWYIYPRDYPHLNDDHHHVLEYVTAESKYDTCMGWSDSERIDRVAKFIKIKFSVVYRIRRFIMGGRQKKNEN